MKLEQIKSLIEQINGATFAGMDMTTTVTLLGGKGNPQQGRVKKHTTGSSVMLFTNQSSNGYENMVKKHLVAEGKNPESFTLGELKWGERVEGTPFISHKGDYYLQVIFLRGGQSTYTIDGHPVEKSNVIGLPIDKSGEYQGLDQSNAVIVRTFKLDNIDALRLMGEEVKTKVAPKVQTITVYRDTKGRFVKNY